MRSFAYIRASSIDEARKHLRTPDAHVHAGGTDLLGCLRDGVFDAARVVSISGIPELAGIVEGEGGGLTIGALTRLIDLVVDPRVKERYAALSQAAVAVGTPQIRNQGTLGGNLCQKPRCPYYRGPFPCRRKGGTHCFAVAGVNEAHALFGGHRCYMVHPSDTAAALTALDASVVIEGPGGRRQLPVADFFVSPRTDPTRETVLAQGELVTHVTLPPAADGLRSVYRKVAPRRCWDFALVGIALALRCGADGVVSEARVVFSGVAPVPWRSSPAEEVLVGHRLDLEIVRRACESAVRGARPLRDNSYKIDLMRGILQRELTAML